MQTFLKKLPWWTFPAIAVLSASVYVFMLFTVERPQNNVFDARTEPLKDCLGTANESDIDCWYERIEILSARNDTTKPIFDDIKNAYETSSYVSSNCHQITHLIGRAAGKKYGSIETAYQDGDSFCWSGYYHGVMEAITALGDTEAILANLNSVCEALKNQDQFSFQHFNCVHGLGHGLMQIQENELFNALDSCDKLDDIWQQESCQGGVFMENVMNGINPGHTATYLKNEEPLYPCTAVEDRHKQQCYLMQTSHALTTVNYDYAQIFSLCSTVEQPYDTTCYQSLGRDASGFNASNTTISAQLCNLGPTETAITNCYIGAVKDFISYFSNDTEAYVFCDTAQSDATKNVCRATAKSYYETF